ncbi:hypothetical protein HC928_26125, partial [bacterium]|nr:hypothetical protein [bacterium]
AAQPDNQPPPAPERRSPPPTPDLIHDEGDEDYMVASFETGFEDMPELALEPSYVDEVSQANGQVPYSSNRRAPALICRRNQAWSAPRVSHARRWPLMKPPTSCAA